MNAEMMISLTAGMILGIAIGLLIAVVINNDTYKQSNKLYESKKH